MSTDRKVPPNSLESEESVLGSILIDNDAINYALEKLRPEDFYKPAHAIMFQAMTQLSEKREPIDIITLSNTLRKLNALENIGGIDAITRLASVVPSSANLPYYANIVKERSMKRKVIHEATQIINEAFQEQKDIEEFLDIAENRILSVSNLRVNPSFHKISDIVQDSIKLVEKLYDQKELVTGLATGLSDLDEVTSGFQPSDLVIIAARPSMGKTALALGFASHASIYSQKTIALFSLEMSKEQLVLRMLCSEANVDSGRVKTGHLEDQDFPKLVQAASRIADAQIYIDDTPAISITELRAKCRRLHKEHPLSLIIVDYLQLMRSPAYSNSREQEISDISRSLKALAKELHVPVIALSQLNRSVEARTEKKPVMSDLRESGAIEQDADIIMFIYRDFVYNPNPENRENAELIIGKHRNGPTGTIKMLFKPELTKFMDMPRDEGFSIDLSQNMSYQNSYHNSATMHQNSAQPLHDGFSVNLSETEEAPKAGTGTLTVDITRYNPSQASPPQSNSTSSYPIDTYTSHFPEENIFDTLDNDDDDNF
jgi:replicative DNA helicase